MISFEASSGGGGVHKRLQGSDPGRGDVGDVKTIDSYDKFLRGSITAFVFLRVQKASLGIKCRSNHRSAPSADAEALSSKLG